MRVPKQFLDAPQIGPGVEHMRRITVPEFVRREVRVQARNFEVALQTHLHHAC